MNLPVDEHPGNYIAGAKLGSHVVLLGCGRMGSAMLAGWLNHPENFLKISVIEPAELDKKYTESDVIAHYSSLDDLANIDATPIDFVVLAVKPQMMAEAVSQFRNMALDKIVFLSIAAGLSCEWISEQLGGNSQVVRAMPNTPAAVGAGITALYAAQSVAADQKEFCVRLLQAIGGVIVLPDEKMMDAVTALSGSGPAYVFLLTEAMQAAGEQLGLPQELSYKLARGTISGVGALLDQDTSDASVLRQNVTSKGGTTAAALSVLMEDDALLKLISRAMSKAEERSRELGK